MKKQTLYTLTLLTSCILSAQAYAGDAEKGKAKSVSCQACHGAAGISQIPTYPNLAGQKELYLVAQLKAFRSQERKNMVMGPMAAGLSDEDINDLAAYYAGLNPGG
ncbi:cytochrome c [Aestuariibacter halophilus]|uniref:Cytochrome c n=1 Tax=Fluctibacter halophilus TaxID=226011 RepID=A0ABS8GAF1_9ALTE|nr:cytochrome c [Aestuariibacter halophilus]MCC2617572.1 cytochrome c [Aestuariibacter halophilus]